MTTTGVFEFTPTADFEVWWNSTETGRDPLGGRPYPSLYSWTHIGLSAVVVTASWISASHWQHRDQRLDNNEPSTFGSVFSRTAEQLDSGGERL